jgi:hypothetical protein
MIIHDLALTIRGETRTTSATVTWEDRLYNDLQVFFETRGGVGDDWPTSDEPSADALLAGCFPLAAVHGEARLRIEGRPCPMLVEGMLTAHAWWTSWGGMPTTAPAIECPARGRCRRASGERRGVLFLSGGVDSLHTLMRNRRIYREDDEAYIRDAVFIHGFDIGKRARDPELAHFQMALRRLEPVAAETGLRLVCCRTNLRHLPSPSGFWLYRHNGAALAAVGHAATLSPATLFIASSQPVANALPMGTHPALDGHYSSQRVTILHDGGRFTRVEKVRDLAAWPTALAALRVCGANLNNQANCGRCEKCLRTQLDLLAVGIDDCPAFGPRLTPLELIEAAVPLATGVHVITYEDLLPALRAHGYGALCRVLEDRIIKYRARARDDVAFERGLAAD